MAAVGAVSLLARRLPVRLLRARLLRGLRSLSGMDGRLVLVSLRLTVAAATASAAAVVARALVPAF